MGVPGNYFHATRNSRVSIKTGSGAARERKRDDSSRDYHAGFSGVPRREMISAPLNPNSARISRFISRDGDGDGREIQIHRVKSVGNITHFRRKRHCANQSDRLYTSWKREAMRTLRDCVAQS